MFPQFPGVPPIFLPFFPHLSHFSILFPQIPRRFHCESRRGHQALLEELEEQLGATSREATELKLQDLESDLRVTFQALGWLQDLAFEFKGNFRILKW